MNFKRCFEHQPTKTVAYIHPERCDCAFVFQWAAAIPQDDLSLQDLVDEWNSAPQDSDGKQRKAIFFFPGIIDNVLTAAHNFVQAALGDIEWNRFTYWSSDNPAGARTWFPTGRRDQAITVQWYLGLKKNDAYQALTNLSGLTIEWFVEAPQKLFVRAHDAEWTVAHRENSKTVGRSDSLQIDFSDHDVAGGDKFGLTGALGTPVLKDSLGSIGFKFTYFELTKQDEEQFTCTSLMEAHLAHAVESDGQVVLALDPRDNPNTTFKDLTQQSRLLFEPGRPIVSHLSNAMGVKLILEVDGVRSRGFGRLNFEVTGGTILGDEWSYEHGEVTFVPHGDFVFKGLAGVPSKPGDSHRIVTGDSATEFVELVVGDVLRFESGRPAVMGINPGDKPPPAPNQAPSEAGEETELDKLLNSGSGYVTTSWMGVVRPTQFHTQPERSPAFGSVAGAPSPSDDSTVKVLERKSVPYGNIAGAIPFFPHGGARPKPSLQEDDEMPKTDYEQRFLSRARQLVVKRDEKPAAADLQEDSAGGPGVTPQGIISSYAGYNVKELSFGEPSGGTVGGGFENEFKLTLKAPGEGEQEARKLYEALQQALRGKDLFMVMRKLDATASGVITISSGLKVRDFSFDVGAKADLGDAVVVLKYFKGKALKDLLPDTAMWACKEHLAKEAIWKEPSADPADANNLSGLVYLKNKDGTYKIPAPLDKVWQDPDWQGVLLLNLTPPAGGLPSLFEALKPGMTEGGLRLHHLGLNYLPVRQEDLKVEKARNGSAFGLLLYSPGTGARPRLDRSDKFPEPNDTTQQPHTPDTAYGFEVKSLEVEFANSQVSRFEAEVDASFSHLFWDKAQGDGSGKHAIPLRGTYESRRKPDGTPQDIFTLTTREPNEVKFDSSWLDKFVITRAELVVTSSEKAPGGALTHIVTFLGLSGDLLFREPPDFNLFKVEKMTVEKLGLEFDYVPPSSSTGESFKCRFRADSIRADVDFGDTGQSLLSSLGLKFKGFRMALDKLLNFGNLGYLPLGNWGGKLLDFHFGLDFELDLGFLGKLSGGKGLKLPLLVGWKAGAFDLSNLARSLGLGISFPNWNGKSFEIGIQSFISIRADSATLKACKGDDGKPTAFAIVLSKARLVLLGHEWPREADLDLALFVPIAKGRRMSWALARSDDGSWLRYLAAGHRIKLPGGKTTKEVVTNFKKILKDVKEDDPTTPEDESNKNDACSLLPSEADTNAWVVAAEFSLAELVQIWIAACDSPAVYGLRVEMLKSGFSADAMYRQLGPEDGVFSAEVSLPESLRTFQVGVATVRMPKLGLEIYTDGGFKVDLGYPWNNDFSRSFQLEIAIFLGSGGFWFSYTSGLGADWIALPEAANGFTRPGTSDLKQYQAVSAGMAMRAGIGRSFEMGILRGEASLTVFSTLEGGIAFRRGDRSRKPVLYGIRGTMGIMLRIWVEVNFIILRATAEFCAYALVGFEIRRVLALKGPDHYGLTLPVKVFAEVGIYVHVEIWVTIGCVRVKLFDLEFRGTWHWEETLGGYSSDLIQRNAVHELEDDGPVLLAEVYPKVEWKPDYLAFPVGEALDIFIAILPCVADPRDLGIDSGAEHQPCVVTQLMLRVHNAQEPEKIQGFHQLGKFMLGWVLQPQDPDLKIMRAQVVDARVQLDADSLWLELMDLVMTPGNPLEKQFAVSLTRVDVGMEADFAALPWWPGIHWQFNADETGTGAPPVGSVQARTLAVDGKSRGGDLCMFVDYLRALTGSLLSETERLIAIADDAVKAPTGISWNELWQRLTESK